MSDLSQKDHSSTEWLQGVKAIPAADFTLGHCQRQSGRVIMVQIMVSVSIVTEIQVGSSRAVLQQTIRYTDDRTKGVAIFW